MQKKQRFVRSLSGLVISLTLAACGTAAVTSEGTDALIFQPQDVNSDIPVVKPDVVHVDTVEVTPDVQDIATDVAQPDLADGSDDIVDTVDVQDVGPPDVYVPECVTDTTCDDKNLCTVDLCANNNCVHSQTPGCCLTEKDCPTAPICKAAQCVNHVCGVQPVANCCASGLCCDPATQSAKVPQAPCNDVAISLEFDCQGPDIWGRRAILGCDGKQTAACSGNTANYNWTEWLPVGSCPGGSLCQKNPDKTQFPACSGAPAPVPSCISDIGCYDADPCTVDTCTGGTCKHNLADSATLCGTSATYTQYDCLPAPGGADAGGSMIMHQQFASCGLAGKCDGKAVWSPWTISQDCLPTEKCDVPISTEPGTCTLIAVCKPGTTCCSVDGQYDVTGTTCGTTTVATEYQCETADKGSKFTKREGVAGCSGTSALCSATTPSWGPWKSAGTCAYNQLCSVPLATAPPVCTDVCTAGSTCCTSSGDWADQGTKCSDQLQKSISKCVASSGVETVLSSSLFPGCTGIDGTCSMDAANLNKSAYSIVKQCQSYEKCVQTGDSADCVLNAPCQPGTQCCTADGQFSPLGAQCAPANKTQYACSNNLPGGFVQTRAVYYGCTGYNGECSYNPANYFLAPWVETTDCQPSEQCTSTDLSFAECTSLYQCVPGTICCDGNGNYMTKGTKCGPPDVKKTYYKCDSTGLSGSILKQEYYAACVGTAANCSALDADLVWDPPVWLTKQSCGPMNYCHVSGPTDPGVCNSTPP